MPIQKLLSEGVQLSSTTFFSFFSFLVDERREDDGPTLNAGLVTKLCDFKGIQTSIAKKSIAL